MTNCFSYHRFLLSCVIGLIVGGTLNTHVELELELVEHNHCCTVCEHCAAPCPIATSESQSVIGMTPESGWIWWSQVCWSCPGRLIQLRSGVYPSWWSIIRRTALLTGTQFSNQANPLALMRVH